MTPQPKEQDDELDQLFKKDWIMERWGDKIHQWEDAHLQLHIVYYEGIKPSGEESVSTYPYTAGYDTIKKSLLAWADSRAAERESVTIMGKTVDEIRIILSALELERIEDLEMTMVNLSEWMKRVQEDHRNAVQKAMKRSFDNTLKGDSDG